MEILEIIDNGKEWETRKEWKCKEADIKLIYNNYNRNWQIEIEYFGKGYKTRTYKTRNSAMNQIRKLLKSNLSQ